MRRTLALLVVATALLGATRHPAGRGVASLPPLPDSSGWGVHILALGRSGDGTIWVGTYGEGIYVLRRGATAWEHLRADTVPGGISFDIVHAFAFAPRGDIWYGTAGNGWGLSRDGGRTWTNWEYRDLGPKWQYVAPDGMVMPSAASTRRIR